MADQLNDSVVSKLLGALKLSEQAQNEFEAASAARRVQSIMAKYHLDNYDLESFRRNSVDKPNVVEVSYYMNGKNNSMNLASLANTIAQYNFVSIFRSKEWVQDGLGKSAKLAKIVFVGRQSNVDIVIQLFEKMRTTMNRISAAEMQSHKGNVHGKAWKSSFEIGFINGLASAMSIERQEFLKMVSEHGKTGMDLVVSFDAENQEFLKKYKLTAGPKRTNKIDYNAFQRGKNIGLNTSTKDMVNGH